ncbi:hypothetical protein HDU96_008873 [Phlyctochytrium bullatum]|nr:hypothetical protein HDU96_008873 [Phlyctochytrium bullatum]
MHIQNIILAVAAVAVSTVSASGSTKSGSVHVQGYSYNLPQCQRYYWRSVQQCQENLTAWTPCQYAAGQTYNACKTAVEKQQRYPWNFKYGNGQDVYNGTPGVPKPFFPSQQSRAAVTDGSGYNVPGPFIAPDQERAAYAPDYYPEPSLPSFKVPQPFFAPDQERKAQTDDFNFKAPQPFFAPEQERAAAPYYYTEPSQPAYKVPQPFFAPDQERKAQAGDFNFKVPQPFMAPEQE